MDMITASPCSVGHVGHLVDTRGSLTRALAFALPVLVDPCAEVGLAALSTVPDVGEVSRLLHGPGRMGTATQGLYLYPRLLSPHMLANLIEPTREAFLAGLMVDDCIGVGQGQVSRLAELVDFERDEPRHSPLRFLLGCVFSDAEQSDEGLSLISTSEWDAGGLRRQFEAALALACMPASASIVRRAVRPRVLPPLPLARAFEEGFVALVDAALSDTGADVRPELHFADSDAVELRLVGEGPVVSLVLSSSLVGFGLIEAVIARTDELLARRGAERAWGSAGVDHH
jgi:hypothetical protein